MSYYNNDLVLEQANRITALEAVNAELTRKGEELCCVYGGVLIKLHDLEAENKRVREDTLAELAQAMGHRAMGNGFDADDWLDEFRAALEHEEGR